MDDGIKNATELVERFGDVHPDVMTELQSMLRLYDIDAQELFFKWESYSMKMGPEDTKLTADSVLAFKKDVQEQLEKEARGKARMQQQTPAIKRAVRPPAGAADSFSLFDGMLPTTPARGSAVKRKFPAAHETPRGGISSRMHLDNQSSPIAASSPLQTPHKPPPAFSLASLEAVTPFSKRTNAGETVEVLNPHLPQPTLPSSDATSESRVSFIFRMDLKSFAYRPMYQKLTEASEALDERIDEFAAAIQEHYSLPDEAFGDASVASPAETIAVGRIVSDSPEGKFNASSVCLESSRMAGGGVRTPLKLDRIASFSFFPGQIVAVKGVNSSGGYFQVHEVLEPPKLPPAATSTAELAATAQKGPVTVFIASGPYTTQDNLAFEALDELCNKAAELQPDVVILTGPFIDSAHPLVQAGDFELEDDEGTLEDLFRQQISRKINRIKNSMVLLIPSVRDAVSKHCAFPQDRLNRKFLGLGDNVKCLPNPSMFSLNELVFGITTNDILFHLSREEIARSPGISNPSARLTSHLLTQRSFYPLFPPPPRDALPGAQNVAGAALDVAHVRLADLVNVTPDVLLLPGLLQPFAKVVDGVVVVNPGMAAKPRGPGTWVVMTVRPKVVEEAAAEEVVAHGVWERARVEVRRI